MYLCVHVSLTMSQSAIVRRRGWIQGLGGNDNDDEEYNSKERFYRSSVLNLGDLELKEAFGAKSGTEGPVAEAVKLTKTDPNSFSSDEEANVGEKKHTSKTNLDVKQVAPSASSPYLFSLCNLCIS
jgi:hypothetical protein